MIFLIIQYSNEKMIFQTNDIRKVHVNMEKEFWALPTQL